MPRPSSLLLPLLLTLPFAVGGQDSGGNLSPALRAKLLTQNAAAPAKDPALPAAAAPANGQAAPGTDQPVPAPGTPAGAPTPAPATPATPTPPAVTPTPTPAPRIPRPSIPLPGGTRPGARPTPGARTGDATPAAAVAPASDGEGVPPDPDNPWGDIAFIDAPIFDVIEKYEQISRRHVLREPNLQGNVTVYANPNPLRPFTREEAAEFMKAALGLQGFIIQEYNETTDKILQLNKPPGIEGPMGGSPLYTREEDLPETDEIVNFVLTLKYLPVADASQVFAQAVPVHQWTKYVAVPSANSIFVQEYVSNIRTLLKVKKSLDLPPVKMVHVWVELERASAEDVQAILDQILQAQTQSRGPAGSSGFRSISPAAAAANLAQPGAVPQVVTAGSQGASSGLMPDGSSVIVKADPRTNRVFINGPEEHVKFLEKLIHEFDEPSRVKSLLTQQLRYIPVNEFFDLALTSLEATGAGQAGSGSAGGGTGTSGARQTGGRSQDFGAGGSGQDFRSNFGSRGTAGTNQFGGGSTGTGSRTGTSRTGRSGIGGGLGGGGAGMLEAPQAQTVGKTLLISDPRTNSLIVSGPPDSIQRVSDLVKEMDRRPFQVHINAVIAQMAIGDDLQTSVDFLRKVETLDINGEAVEAAGFFRSAASGTFIDPSSLTTEAAFSAISGSGFNLFATAGELFNAYVRVLETSNKAKLLAKPHITVANNKVGSISSGERVPIPSNQQSTVVAGGTTSLNSSIEYENVVLSLEVQPLINSKNEITLTVSQLNDTVNGTTSINGNDIPNIATQELLTEITIPNGAILVLGGLVSEQERRTNTGVPILSKIPIVKYLIGSNGKNKQRRELLILLQARIIESADDIVDVNVSEIQRTVVGPDAELFAKPDRNTDNVKLPTFENDVPFNEAGIQSTTETTVIPDAPSGKSTRTRSRSRN
jgi:general secretion pathway protein D